MLITFLTINMPITQIINRFIAAISFGGTLKDALILLYGVNRGKNTWRVKLLT